MQTSWYTLFFTLIELFSKQEVISYTWVLVVHYYKLLKNVPQLVHTIFLYVPKNNCFHVLAAHLMWAGANSPAETLLNTPLSTNNANSIRYVNHVFWEQNTLRPLINNKHTSVTYWFLLTYKNEEAKNKTLVIVGLWHLQSFGFIVLERVNDLSCKSSWRVHT